MQYIEVIITTHSESADLLCTLLEPFAEENSVIQEQLGDPNDLRADAMLNDIAVKFWFSEDKDSQEFRSSIDNVSTQVGCGAASFTLLDSVDWTTEWRKNYQPVQVGDSFIIVPPWTANPEPARTPVLIDPGIAFGTGQHETTRLCITQLEKHVKPGMHVLDLGSGSAILSIVTKHLGATQIAAVEIDEDAVRSAAENLKLNKITDIIDLHVGSLETVEGKKWDLIVANILAVILMKLVREEGLLDIVKPGGRIIFSGIINSQLEEFTQTIDQSVYEVEEITSEGEWVAVTICRLTG